MRTRHPWATKFGVVIGLVAAFATTTGAAQPTHHGHHSEKRIAFTKTDAETGDSLGLWTADPNLKKQRLVWPGAASFPAWSPDRRRLLFDFTDDNGNQQLATIRPDGSGFRQLTRMPGISESADYSPNGRWIVFDRSPSTDFENPDFLTTLWVIRSDGKYARPLKAGAKTFDVEPEYSPNGRSITFARLRVDANGVFTAAMYVARADGSRERRLTPFLNFAEHPRWSPDGRHVLFNIENFDDQSHPSVGIWRVRATGGPMKQLLSARDSQVQGFKPDYSPDGKRIMFPCVYLQEEVSDDLCVMNADGRKLRRLTNTPTVHENHLVWD